MKANQAQFIEVSEAWKILSKLETKQSYDRARARYMGKSFGSANHYVEETQDHHTIAEGYNTQRINFTKVQSRASSNWTDLQEKYKSEKWNKLPLQERKVSFWQNLCCLFFLE
jgi:curved DNA-binding protein CbpA